MRTRSFRALVAVVLLGSALLPWISRQDALACTCYADLKPIADAYREASAVFLGRVERVSQASKGRTSSDDPATSASLVEFDGVLARVTVLESFKGIESSSVDVGSAKGCFTFRFVEGESYLFYAARDTNGALPFVSTCGRSRRAVLAAADLEFLSGLPETIDEPRVTGTVTWGDVMFSDDHALPLPDVRVTLAGPDRTLETLTDARGVYRFTGVAQGDHSLTIHLPEHLTAINPALPMTIGKTWVIRDLDAWLNGRIRGRLLGPDGKTVAGVKVGTTSVDAARVDADLAAECYTDEDGAFILEGLTTGQYVLVVNPIGRADSDSPFPKTYFPGVAAREDATAVPVDAGKETSIRDFQLPTAFERVVIRGVVVDKAGKPWPKAWVRIEEVVSEREQASWRFGQSTWQGVIEADSSGQFSFTVLSGKSYEVDAALRIEGKEDDLTNRVTLRARTDMPAVRLVAHLVRKSPSVDVKKDEATGKEKSSAP